MSKARIILPVEGMSCASCAATVQEALASADGVVGATVNFATGKAAVDYDDGQTHVADVVGMGGAMLLMADRPMDSFKRFDLLGRLLMPAALKLWALVSERTTIDLFWIKVGLAVLTLPVVAWSGQQFYKGTWSGFKHRTADMNTLIGVGTGAAYLYSLVATFAPDVFAAAGLPADVYYEGCCRIIACVPLGRVTRGNVA